MHFSVSRLVPLLPNTIPAAPLAGIACFETTPCENGQLSSRRC